MVQILGLVSTHLTAWPSNAQGEGTYPEPYKADEEVWIKGRLYRSDTGVNLEGMGIDILVDGKYINRVVKTDVKGEFHENLGKMVGGNHVIRCIFYPWGEYNGSEDSDTITVIAIATSLDMWAATPEGWAKGEPYVEPVTYLINEEVYVRGNLKRTDTEEKLVGYTIDILIDNKYIDRPVVTDSNGEFLESLGIFEEGSHEIKGIFYPYGEYDGSSDIVYVEIARILTYMDLSSVDEEGNPKSAFRVNENVYTRGILTAEAIADGGVRMKEMNIDLLIDDEYFDTVLTDENGEFIRNLGMLGMGPHTITGIFYPWEIYAGSQDIENAIFVGAPRAIEMFPRLDKFIRSRPIWKRYAVARWSE